MKSILVGASLLAISALPVIACGPADRPGDIVFDQDGQRGTLVSCDPLKIMLEDGAEVSSESLRSSNSPPPNREPLLTPHAAPNS